MRIFFYFWHWSLVLVLCYDPKWGQESPLESVLWKKIFLTLESCSSLKLRSEMRSGISVRIYAMEDMHVIKAIFIGLFVSCLMVRMVWKMLKCTWIWKYYWRLVPLRTCKMTQLIEKYGGNNAMHTRNSDVSNVSSYVFRRRSNPSLIN